MGWFSRLFGRRSPQKLLAAQREATEAVLDAVLRQVRSGQPQTDVDVASVGHAMSGLWQALVAQHGTDDNTRFPPDDQVHYFVQALKAAALDHPSHNAWPVLSDLRRPVFEPLRQRVSTQDDPWLHLCLITPALLHQDVATARRSFERIQADPFLRQRALCWVNYTESAYSAFNDVPSARAFLDALPDAEPWNPTTTFLDEGTRFALLASIHPFLPADPRVSFPEPFDGAVVRVGLKSDWDITDRETALSTLGWLQEEGHRGALVEDLQADGEPSSPKERYVREHRDALLQHHVLAWDLARLISTARACLTAGYLEVNETARWVRGAAEKLRGEYASWEEFGDDFLLGLGYWNAESADPEMPYPAMVRWLKESPRSPWKRVPFRGG